MARKKRIVYSFKEIYRQDKIDDFIFAYFIGVRSIIPTANLTDVAKNFQKDFLLSEDDCALDIIIASFHRTASKHLKNTKINND
jgi:hypothetical protein